MNELRKGFVEAGSVITVWEAQTVAELILARFSAWSLPMCSATLSEDGKGVLIDVADATGPNGQKTFVVEVRQP
jgi:hypothetical protein